MSIKSILFPSVIESNSVELPGAAPDMLSGLRISEDNTSYIIGDLALAEGSTPLRAINGSPSNMDYKLLFKSGLLLSNTEENSNLPKVIITGFPFSTYQVNREETVNLYRGIHNISYDSSTFSGEGISKPLKVVVHDIAVIPEIMACVLGAREFEENLKGKFFAVSLGFGSFDACLANEKGLVQRTILSNYGMRYAVNLFAKELSKKFYLDMRSEHQLDKAFTDGFIILNRKRYNITDLRKIVLERYYKDIISPSLKNAWKDDDFVNTNYLVLAGGGALYSDLLKCFEEEFRDLISIKVVNDPLTIASKGYYLYGINVLGVENKYAIGLDIGNAHTVVTFEEHDNANTAADDSSILNFEYKSPEKTDITFKSRYKFDDTSNAH